MCKKYQSCMLRTRIACHIEEGGEEQGRVCLTVAGGAWYAVFVMRKVLLLQLCAAFALVLPMCEQTGGPLPAGSIRATDPEAEALMQKAIEYRNNGKLGKAKGELRELLSEHGLAPNAPQARFMLAELYEQMRDPREAFKQYGKVVENYQNSSLYEAALNRQLAMATAAANGQLQARVFGMWNVPMESSVVIEWLEAVTRNAPYNEMSATATSVLADYLVKQEKYEAACQVYRRLVDNYPDSRYAPGAQMMVAKLWAASHTRGDQNLVNLANAQEAYEEFTLRFPNHPDAKKAYEEAKNVRRLLVQQELEVGRYYLDRSKEYTSAIFCFESVIRQKKVNPEAAREAEKLLARARQAVAGKTPAA